MIYLAAVCHNVKSNTLEATWIEETEIELKRVKCRNYSAEQKDELLTVVLKVKSMSAWLAGK